MDEVFSFPHRVYNWIRIRKIKNNKIVIIIIAPIITQFLLVGVSDYVM